MGISKEIEDVKITTEKTEISRLKQRSVIDHNSCDQIELSDIKLSIKTHKHYRKYLSFLNLASDHATFHCDFDNCRLLSLPRNHVKPLQG